MLRHGFGLGRYKQKKTTMKKVVLIALVGASIVFSETGCKKYEDGPTISFVSRKDRISNTWEIESVIKNGDDYTTTYNAFAPNLKYDINKNGSMTASQTIGSVPVNLTGSWTFQSNDEEVKFSFSTGDQVYIILRLKQKELWLKQVAGGDTFEYHFKQA